MGSNPTLSAIIFKGQPLEAADPFFVRHAPLGVGSAQTKSTASHFRTVHGVPYYLEDSVLAALIFTFSTVVGAFAVASPLGEKVNVA